MPALQDWLPFTPAERREILAAFDLFEGGVLARTEKLVADRPEASEPARFNDTAEYRAVERGADRAVASKGSALDGFSRQTQLSAEPSRA